MAGGRNPKALATPRVHLPLRLHCLPGQLGSISQRLPSVWVNQKAINSVLPSAPAEVLGQPPSGPGRVRARTIAARARVTVEPQQRPPQPTPEAFTLVKQTIPHFPAAAEVS